MYNRDSDGVARVTGHQVWAAYLNSVVIFLIHKMECRLPGSPANPDRYPDWHRQMPGLLVSHEPFDSLLSMGLTLAFQATLVCLGLYLLHRALRALDERASAPLARLFVLGFTAAWGYFAYFETHHIHKLVVEQRYFPGSIFAILFVAWVFLVLVPLVLRHQVDLGVSPRPAVAPRAAEA